MGHQGGMQAKIVEDLGQGAFRCRLSEAWDGYEYVIVVAEKPPSLPERTRIYAALSEGPVNIGVAPLDYVILAEVAGEYGCLEALSGFGIQLDPD